MSKALSRRGVLPNGRPDKQTMANRYRLLQRLQGRISDEMMDDLVDAIYQDAVFGIPEVKNAARSLLFAHLLPKAAPSAGNDAPSVQQNITNLVLKMSEQEKLALAAIDLSAVQVVDADVADAHSS